jgi:OOP family OmpA-OmpF porin
MMYKVRMILSAIIVSGLLIAGMNSISRAGDIRGSRDHPMISRYAGSEIIKYTTEKFNEYNLFIKKAARYGGKGKNLDATLRVEGKITQITYKTPKERSTLEVFRNYESALREAGFKTLYSCSHDQCGGRNFNHAVAPYDLFGENYKDQRYLAAKLQRQGGDVYVSLYIVRNTSGAGPTHNLIYTKLDVIETRPMEAGMVTVDADAMANEISKTGHVAVYGIYFDTDKAEVKPESEAALDEIAKLLRRKKSLALVVVGHTDNQGSLEYNMDLSKRRAKAVVDILVKKYGIHAGRLQSWGAGYLSPAASNKTEAGRAKNRRVELVEQ